MAEKTILFVAQAQAVTALFPHFKESGVTAGIVDSLPAALGSIRKSKPCLVFSQAKIGVYTAEALLAEAAKAPGFPPVIVMAERGSAEEARRYLEMGARDYWLEPVPWDKVRAVLPEAVDIRPAPRSETGREAAPTSDAPGLTFAIIGDHPAIRRVLALARQVAKSKATVLISGESGTGKEMFARFLHAHSDRAGGPFVAINCAALPEHLLESELFGHEKGSFTGAIARKLGKFEMAHGGSILLDEISEMDLGLQAKLLRVLQEGECDRVGGTEAVRVDTRVLATTNRKLESYVEEGKFRQDLYYRLNVIPLKLPPLRERGGDILKLADYFVDKFSRGYGLKKPPLSAEATAWLTAHDWPGNVRELQNLMERAVLLAGGGEVGTMHFLLDEDALPDFEADEDLCLGQEAASEGTPDAEAAAAGEHHGEIVPLDIMERRLIMKSLDRTEGNRTQAAQLLGISVRTLRNKLNEYRKLGIHVP